MAQNSDPVVRTDSPEVIAQDIRETRSDMSETIDALATKLDPDNLKAQATDAISGAAHDMIDKAKDAFSGSGDGGGSMVDSMMTQVRGSSALDAIKENPLPALAVGLSLAWFVSKLGESEQERYRAERFHATGDPAFAPRGRAYLDAAYQSYPEYGSGGRYRGGQDPLGYGEPARLGAAGGGSAGTGSDASITDQAGDALSTARDKASDLASTAGDKASDLADQAKSAVSGAVGTVKEAASNAADAVAGTAGSLGDDAPAPRRGMRAAAPSRCSATRRRGWTSRCSAAPSSWAPSRSPLAALVGLSLPETDAEQDLMGDQAQRIREQAKQQALAAAGAAQGTIADAASTVAEEAKAATDDVIQTAKDEGRRRRRDG